MSSWAQGVVDSLDPELAEPIIDIKAEREQQSHDAVRLARQAMLSEIMQLAAGGCIAFYAEPERWQIQQMWRQGASGDIRKVLVEGNNYSQIEKALADMADGKQLKPGEKK